MSDANRVKLSYVGEGAAFGVAKAATLKVLRHTGESLKQDTTVIVSEELRSDRQIADIIRTGVGASGGINFELSYGTYDDFLKAILCSANWSAEKSKTATTISASSVDNCLRDSEAGFITAGFVRNQWIKISGFTTTALGNNGFAKIVSVDSDEMILSNKILISKSAGDEVTIQMGSQIKNGTENLLSWNIERQYIDLDPDVFSLFTGMCLNTLSLDIPADGTIKGTMAFLGSLEDSLNASAGVGYADASITKIMTGANHVDQILENETEIGILSFTLNITNNLRQRLQVGTLGATSVGTGTIEISGSISLYLSDAILFDKYLDQTPTSLAIAVTDGVGNSYLIEIPAIKLVDGSRPAGGLNTDVVGDFEWRACLSDAESISIRITRFPLITGQLAGSIAGLSDTLGDVEIS